MNMVKTGTIGIALAFWLFLVLDARGQAIDIAAAKKEGKVVVYGSVVPQAMEELHKNFELKYGDQSRLLARVLDRGSRARTKRVARRPARI